MDLEMKSVEPRKVAPGRLATPSRDGFWEAVWYPLVVPAARIRVPGCDVDKEKAAASSGFIHGSDGTRTRDLRRDRPAL
jgi:hypothetical protein